MRTAAIIRCGASMGKGRLCRTELGKVVIGDPRPAPPGYLAPTITSIDIVPKGDVDSIGEGFASPCHGNRYYDRGVVRFNAQHAPGAGSPDPITLYCDGDDSNQWQYV